MWSVVSHLGTIGQFDEVVCREWVKQFGIQQCASGWYPPPPLPSCYSRSLITMQRFQDTWGLGTGGVAGAGGTDQWSSGNTGERCGYTWRCRRSWSGPPRWCCSDTIHRDVSVNQ